ncbi:MaoC/PaaZ C-terminal domain-containing protein [Thermaurantiacus sp.]
MRDFEDFAVGDRLRMGPTSVSRLQALAFAKAYDPQPFLLSDEGAASHPLVHRMAASGWMVAALAHRLLIDDMLANPVALVAEPGVDRLRWLRTVHPGDSLTLEADVIQRRRLASRPGLGLVRMRLRMWNQARALVMTAVLLLLVEAPLHPVVEHRIVSD